MSPTHLDSPEFGLDSFIELFQATQSLGQLINPSGHIKITFGTTEGTRFIVSMGLGISHHFGRDRKLNHALCQLAISILQAHQKKFAGFIEHTTSFQQLQKYLATLQPWITVFQYENPHYRAI